MQLRVHKKEKLTAMIRFLVTPSLRERLWRYCAEHGILPSEVLRAGLRRELERLERETTKTEEASTR